MSVNFILAPITKKTRYSCSYVTSYTALFNHSHLQSMPGNFKASFNTNLCSKSILGVKHFYSKSACLYTLCFARHRPFCFFRIWVKWNKNVTFTVFSSFIICLELKISEDTGIWCQNWAGDFWNRFLWIKCCMYYQVRISCIKSFNFKISIST